MAKPTIASLTEENIQLYQQADALNSEIIALREQCEQYKALNDAQAERITKAVVAYKRDQAEITTLQAEIAELRAELAAKPAQAPAKHDHQAVLKAMMAAKDLAKASGKSVTA
jgi:uncharacterized coiled-coil DUF342 family protein